MAGRSLPTGVWHGVGGEEPKSPGAGTSEGVVCVNDNKDAFDLWWQWAEKPRDSLLTINAEMHHAVIALPEERRDRAKVNEAVREGVRAWPAAACRQSGPVRRSEGDGVVAVTALSTKVYQPREVVGLRAGIHPEQAIVFEIMSLKLSETPCRGPQARRVNFERRSPLRWALRLRPLGRPSSLPPISQNNRALPTAGIKVRREAARNIKIPARNLRAATRRHRAS
jgi:hypothetical protein